MMMLVTSRCCHVYASENIYMKIHYYIAMTGNSTNHPSSEITITTSYIKYSFP